jgi:hypothetical protein
MTGRIHALALETTIEALELANSTQPTLIYNVVAHWDTGASVLYASTSKDKATMQCAKLAAREDISYSVSACYLD